MRLRSLLVLLALAAPAPADDWPQWLGPRRDGVWRETGVLDKFPKDGPRVKWRVPVGAGYSGPAVAGGKGLWTHDYPCTYQVSYASGPRATPLIEGDRVYTLGTMGNLLCLDTGKGGVIWS